MGEVAAEFPGEDAGDCEGAVVDVIFIFVLVLVLGGVGV